MHQRQQPGFIGIEHRRRPTAWEACSTPQGRGTYLVGADGADVLVLAPPGVRLPTEEGTELPLCSEGWRLATFVPRNGQPPLVDRHRPQTVYDVGVRGALIEVLSRCPGHLGWLADRLEEIVRSAWMISQADVNGDVPLLAERRAHERDELLDELVPVLEQLVDALPADADERLLDPWWMVALRDELEDASARRRQAAPASSRSPARSQLSPGNASRSSRRS